MKCSGREKHHIEIRVLQPTMSSTRMVVGDILSGILILLQDSVILKLIAMIIANKFVNLKRPETEKKGQAKAIY